jgi:hypothetical protein
VALGALALAAAGAPAGAQAAGSVGTSAQGAPYAIAPGGSGLQLTGLFSVGGQQVTVPGRVVTLTGRITPYVRGQRVTLLAAVDGQVFRRVRLRLHRFGRTGRFMLRLAPTRAGVVTISVLHSRTRVLRAFDLTKKFSALAPTAAVGSHGLFVQLIQQQLAALHFYIPQTGVYDQGTALALDAYHRLLGLGEGHTSLDPLALKDLLNGVGSFHVRYPTQGQHAEGDLSDQVLAFINGSQVYWLFPISSGKPSTPTILGNFQVYYKEPNYTPDGMYFSAFFHGGYAIHGYDPAPDYPASHGCMRLPMVDAIPAYNWINVGDWVDTYYT